MQANRSYRDGPPRVALRYTQSKGLMFAFHLDKLVAHLSDPDHLEKYLGRAKQW